MIQVLESALVEFAARRSERLNEFDREIRPLVIKGLDDYARGNADWYEDIVTAAGVLWSEIFEQQSPTGIPGTRLDTYLTELRASLAKTETPDDPPTDAQIDRVARWVGVYTVNSATFFAGRDKGGLEKTWITMEDDKVRSMHREVDRATVNILGTFTVGGVQMHFPGEPVGSPEHWINCRCILHVTGGTEMRTKTESFAARTGEAPVDTAVEEDGALSEDDLTSGDLVDDVTEVPWHGVLTVEGIDTGDKRRINSNALTFPDPKYMPAPLMYQEYTDGVPHGKSVRVGRIDRMERDEPTGEIRGYGAFNLNVLEAQKAIDGIVFGGGAGVSVDLDSTEMELEFPEGTEEMDLDQMMAVQPTEVITAGQLRGATMVGFGAFIQGYISLGESFDEEVRDPSQQYEDLGDGYDADDLEELFVAVTTHENEDEKYALVASAFAPGTHDGPGWLKNPRATERLRRYWVHGEGAAKIRWNLPGDFNRCRRQLAKYVNPAFLAGTCANLHKEAIKVWPGQEAGGRKGHVSDAETFALVASATTLEEVKAAWFEDPHLSDPTPLTIDGNRVYGHLAQWGVCHIGIGDRCVMPPTSPSGYAYALHGVIDTDEGPVRTSPVIMGTGHANLRINAMMATKHYDDTGYAVADVAYGEDAIGIWYAGILRPGISDEDVYELKASGALSGDWRNVKRTPGSKPDELVAAIAVNTPGNPIPAYGFDGDVQMSLIASAGFVRADREPESALGSQFKLGPDDLLMIGRAVNDEREYREQKITRIAEARDPELIEAANTRRAERIAAARSLED